MGRLKHLIVLAALNFNLQVATAQNSISSNDKQTIYCDETVFINTNATTFVAGETLYYKLNCLKSSNKTASYVSKLAYVELIDEDKTITFRNKLFLENAKGQGEYFVPATIKTGKYKFIGYTNWMLNQNGSPFFEMDIIIINPFQETKNQINNTNTSADTLAITQINATNSSVKNESENKYLKLFVAKKSFSTREQVDLILESSNEVTKTGNYSVSIRKLDDLPSIKPITAEAFSKKNFNLTSLNKSPKIILPELRGEMITGKISCKNKQNDIQNINIGLSIPGKSFAFKVVKTDKNGNFTFNLEYPYYNSTINIQVINDKRFDYTITLDEPINIDFSKLNFATKLDLKPVIAESLLDRSIASQIENAYYTNKRDSIQKTKTIDAFYQPVAREYVLDDYTRFPTLKETTIEIVKEMYFEQKDKNYTLHLRDFTIYTQSPEPALVLIDGLLIQNVNELFEYNMKNIDKISVVSGLYFLGPKAFNGVISFTTKTQDYLSTQSGSYILDTTILRPSIKKDYFTPDYKDKSKNERIPDYRYQLLWIPQLNLPETKTPLSFYTSDVTGKFEINIEGFTENGIPISLTDTFEVQ